MELNYEVSKSKKQKGKTKHIPGCGECVRYEGYNSILTTIRKPEIQNEITENSPGC